MKAKRALADTYIEGVKSSLDVLQGIVASGALANEACDTQWLEGHLPSVLASGKQITTALAPIFRHMAPTVRLNTVE